MVQNGYLHQPTHPGKTGVLKPWLNLAKEAYLIQYEHKYFPFQKFRQSSLKLPIFSMSARLGATQQMQMIHISVQTICY